MKHNALRRLCAVIIGIVFLGSGLLKLEDPVGTMLIVKEYARFLHLGFLASGARAIGVCIGLVEAVTGIALITGVLRKVTAIATLSLTGIFTFITLILWIANPQMDCGCFGEAIHLTHFQSFIKNVVLTGLALVAFLPMRDFGEPASRKWVSACIAVLSLGYVVIYSNTHIPIADYTDFDLGAELFASLDDGIQADNHYVPVLTFEKDGQRGTFPLSHLPDSSWTLVQTDTVFREGTATDKTYPILSFHDGYGNYLDSLAAKGKVVVFSVYNPAKANWNRIARQYSEVMEAGGTPLLLVASYPAEIDNFDIPIELGVNYADYKTLITLNRSNGGGSYFRNGELLNKWHERDFPRNIKADFDSDPIDFATYCIQRRRVKAQGFVLYLAALLILV